MTRALVEMPGVSETLEVPQTPRVFRTSKVPQTPSTLEYQPSMFLPNQNLAGTRSSRSWTELPGNFDKLNCRALFHSGNEWGIPDLTAARLVPGELVAYNSRADIEKAGPGAAVHFFLDDYRFETVWNRPERSLSRITSVGAALTPDFSLWRDMPLAMQLWQVYRARWCGAWLVKHGIRVIPTVGWSTPESWPFCFAGIEPGSVVALSTAGVRDPLARQLFAAGYAEMVRQLSPSLVLCYGRPPPEQQVPVRSYPTRWDVNGRSG